MKRIYRLIMTAMLLGCTFGASAQYYQIANQLTNLISPALSGSFNYKGYVDFSGIAGIGTARANFFSVSTTQGFKYADWFFMGAGMGVDLAMTHKPDKIIQDPYQYPWMDRPTSTTMAMIPVFSDFRFIIPSGGAGIPGVYIDLKIGASWLIGNNDLLLDGAHMGHGAQFYFKPSIGLRIPVDTRHPNRAFDIGFTYQLLTSNNFYTYNSGAATLNGLGFTVAYEW